MKVVGYVCAAVGSLLISWQPANAKPYAFRSGLVTFGGSILDFEHRLDDVKVDFVRKRRGRRGPALRAFCQTNPSHMRCR